MNLKPNILSILIGVNDYWHFRDGNYTGTKKPMKMILENWLKEQKKNYQILK